MAVVTYWPRARQALTAGQAIASMVTPRLRTAPAGAATVTGVCHSPFREYSMTPASTDWALRYMPVMAQFPADAQDWKGRYPWSSPKFGLGRVSAVAWGRVRAWAGVAPTTALASAARAAP